MQGHANLYSRVEIALSEKLELSSSLQLNVECPAKNIIPQFYNLL